MAGFKFDFKAFSLRKKIILIAVAVLLAVIILTGIYAMVEAISMKNQAKLVKAEVKEIISCMSRGDMDAAEANVARLNADNEKLRASATTPLWRTVAKLPGVGKQLQSAVKLTYILDSASSEVFTPMIGLLREYPIASLNEDGKINGKAIKAYVDFAEEITPVLSRISDEMTDIDVRMIDGDGKITAYLNQFMMLSDILTVANETVIVPLSDQLEKYPTDSLKNEDGFNNAAIRSYLVFLDEILPEVRSLVDYVEGKDLSAVDPDGKIKSSVAEVGVLVDFLDDASDMVVGPLIDQLDACPLDEIKAGDDGFNVVAINSYLTFIETNMPAFKQISQQMGALKFEHLDANGKISEYREKLDHIIEVYEEGEEYLPLVHTLLGDGSDKFYLFVAQNSAEIRASGGFPGSVGSLVIEDGVMTIGEFERVYDLFYYSNPAAAKITYEERLNFVGLPYPWDACFCPDFERVGEIMALAYEDKNKVKVDGVVSMTPAVIQELLKFLGEIELSDGTVLDGENCTEFLQNGIYNKYQKEFSKEFEGNSFVDDLFSETAKKTMGILVHEFKIGYMPEFLKVLHDGIKDRIILFYFADEAEEELARQCGSSGCISRDEENPEVGIYFSLANACKMGWFLDIDVEISDGTENEDGSMSYDMTVTFTNVMDPKDVATSSYYITTSGYMDAAIQLFAPAGGTVSDFKTDNWSSVVERTYNERQLGYLHAGIGAGKSITVTYTVTTAPGVKAPLGYVTTPTLTKYR